MQGIDDRGCPGPEIPGDQNEERRKAGNEVGDEKWGKERRTVTHHQQISRFPILTHTTKWIQVRGQHRGVKGQLRHSHSHTLVLK